MADFLTSYAPVKKFEGGWCNVVGDSGGETYGGCARNFFPEWTGWSIVDACKKDPSFKQGAADFSRYLAKNASLQAALEMWYREEWWNRLGLQALPQTLADEIFEQSVNLGRGGAGKYVQRLCNGFNWHKRASKALFPQLKEDGVIGPKTLEALGIVLRERSEDGSSLVHALNCMQGAHYVGLAAKNYQHRRFLDGWLTRTYDPC